MFEDQTKAFDEGGARGSVQARARPSPMMGGSDWGPVHFESGVLNLVFPQAAEEFPAWSIWPARRDTMLRRFWKTEPLIAGAVYSLTARMKALNYKIEADQPRLKKYYQDLAGQADLGEGLAALVAKTITDLLTQDNGAFWEKIGAGTPDGPLIGRVEGIAHLDAANCWRTFDPEYPVIYRNPETGKHHKLHHTRVIRMASMPQPNELGRGIGFCGVSRVLNIVRTMRAYHRYKYEKLTGTQKAVGYGNGFNVKQFNDAIAATKNQAEAEGLVIWNGVPFLLNPDMDGKVDLGVLSLTGLPDGFDAETDTTLYIYALALGMGVDAREFWPATASGATKADATIQHLKAQGKGIGDLIQIIEHAWNWHILPDGVTFEYDFTDDEQDLMKAQIQSSVVTTLTSLKNAGAIDAEELRMQAIAKGILDPTQLKKAMPDTEQADPNAKPESRTDPTDALPGTPEGDVKSTKDYDDTRGQFVGNLTRILEGQIADDLTRRQMAAQMRTQLNRLGLQAFTEGLAAGGATPESLSQDELKVYRDWQQRQSEYVTSLGSALYKDGVKLEDAQAKAETWARMSLDEIRFAGERFAAPKKRKKWVRGARRATGDSCEDCKRLDGQVHTVEEWEKSGWLPWSGKTECKSYKCGCDLIDTDEPIFGSF